MSYLKYTVEADILTNSDQITYNNLLIQSDMTPCRVGELVSGVYEDRNKAAVQAMTPSDAAANCVVYARSGVGDKIIKSPAETAYVIPTKAINDDIWWITKPDASLMTNVTGYTEIETLDPSWLDPLP